MKRLLTLLALLISSVAHADYVVPAGATSQMVDVFVGDSSSTTGAGLTGLAFNSGSLTCYYHRANASSATSITLASSTLGTYTSGCFKEVSSSNAPGQYQFCPPDAAFASGADNVTFMCKGATNMVPVALRVQIAPKVNLADSSIASSTYAARGTAQAVTGTTIQFASSETFANDELNNNASVYIVSASTGAGQVRCITDYVGSTDTATVDTWTTTPTGTITYDLIPTPNCIGNVNQWKGTTLASTDTAGYPVVTIKNGTGSGEITTTSGLALSLVGSMGSGSITSAAFASGAIDATAIAANAIGASEMASDGASEIAAATWDLSQTGHATSGTFGEAVTNVGTSGDIADAVWNEALSGHNTSSTFGNAVTNLGANAADAVWDEALSGHAVSGSTGEALTDAAAGGGGGGSLTLEDFVTTDTGVSKNDLEGNSVVDIVADVVEDRFNDVINARGDDFVASLSPLSYGGVDYDDLGFGGASAPMTVFIPADDTGPTSITADSTRLAGFPGINPGIDNIHVALVDCDGQKLTVYLEEGVLESMSATQDCSGVDSVFENVALGPICTASTCANFKSDYFSVVDDTSNMTFNGFTGFDNAGTVSVVSGETTPPTVNYSAEAVDRIKVNVVQWNDDLVATPNTAGVPVVETSELGTQAKADVNAEAVDALSTDTYTELSACPSATASPTGMLRYLYMLARNKWTQTSSTATLFKDDGSSTLCTYSTSDNGTTLSKGEGS